MKHDDDIGEIIDDEERDMFRADLLSNVCSTSLASSLKAAQAYVPVVASSMP